MDIKNLVKTDLMNHGIYLESGSVFITMNNSFPSKFITWTTIMFFIRFFEKK